MKFESVRNCFSGVREYVREASRTFTLFPNPSIYLSKEWDEEEGDDDVIKQAKAYVIRDIPVSQKRGQYFTTFIFVVALVCSVVMFLAYPPQGSVCFLGTILILFLHLVDTARVWKDWTK